MNVNPISFGKTVRIHESFENAQKVTKALNSKNKSSAASSLGYLLNCRKDIPAVTYRDYEGKVYILTEDEASFAKEAQKRIDKIKKNMMSHARHLTHDEYCAIKWKLTRKLIILIR